MSWSRFGLDKSDVYTFPNSDGRYECCGCILVVDEKPLGYHLADTAESFLEHLQEHVRAGHRVPDYTFGAVRHWGQENPEGW